MHSWADRIQSKWLRTGILVVGAVLILCVVFGAGVFVGRWSVYTTDARPLIRPRRGLFFSGAHGAIGTLQNVEGQTIGVRLRDGTLQPIVVDNQTRIERNRKKIVLTDLKTGDSIQVIGTPDAQGQIHAKWIRVLDRSTPWGEFR